MPCEYEEPLSDNRYPVFDCFWIKYLDDILNKRVKMIATTAKYLQYIAHIVIINILVIYEPIPDFKCYFPFFGNYCHQISGSVIFV